MEVVASRASTAYRWAVAVGQIVASSMAERARKSHSARMAAAFKWKLSIDGTQQCS